MWPVSKKSLPTLLKLSLLALPISLIAPSLAMAHCTGAGVDFFDIEQPVAEEAAFQMANDGLLIAGGTDRGFTNGLFFEKKCFGKPYKIAQDGERIYFDEKKGGVLSGRSGLAIYKSNSGYLFGQGIYTPGDITEKEIIADDRPYAGWLFGGVYIETYTSTGFFSRYSLVAGCLGPCSFAEETQVIGHKIIANSPQPMGCDNQIGNELGFLFSYERRQVRYVHSFESSEAPFYVFDITDSAVFSVGNIFNNISFGATARLGEFKPHYKSFAFAGPDQRFALPSDSDPFAGSFMEWFIFLRVDGRVTLYDATMEGGLFSGEQPHTVEPEEFSTSLQFGLELVWERLSLRYNLGFSGRDFRGDTGGDDYSIHGIFFISHRW